MQSRLYRVPDVAEILSTGRTMIYHLMKTGQLKSVKVGGCRRVSSTDLEEYISSLRDRTE